MSNYGNKHKALAEMFAALSNPHRLALFERLCTCCPGASCSVEDATRLSVGDVGAGFEIAPSTLSHHLKTLKQAGLVMTERRGKQVECWVEPATLEMLTSFFAAACSLSGDDDVE